MKLQDNFKAYCDGELSIAERDQVTKHLESNEADRKAVEDLQRLSKAIREYVTQPEPAGLEQTLAALEKAKPRARQQMALIHQLRWVGGAVAIVVGIGFIGMVFFPVFAQDKSQAKRSLALERARGTGASVNTSDGASANGGESLSVGQGRSGEDLKAPAASPMDLAGHVPAATKTPSPNSTGGLSMGLTPDKGASRLNGINRVGGARADEARTSTTPPAVHRGPQPLIQKNASLTVKVKSVADAQQNIEGVAAGHGGWVQQSNRSEGQDQTGTATLILRVPVSQFDFVLKSIRALGDVVSDSSSGNDVTGDVVDMDARLKVLRAEEADYMVILSRARRLGEIVELRDKLTEIRTEIESITSQRNVAKDMAAFSTINVTLEQKPTIGQEPKVAGQDTWLNDTWANAVNGLAAAGKLFAQLFIFVLVWAPIWLPTALVGAWVYRKLKW